MFVRALVVVQLINLLLNVEEVKTSPGMPPIFNIYKTRQIIATSF